MARLTCVLMLVVVASVCGKPEKPHYDVKDAPALFEKYIKDYNKVYKDDADREEHYKAFVHSLEDINKSNAESNSATFDLNQFSDYTPKEQELMRGLKLPESSR